MSEHPPQLRMRRTLEELPELTVPDGYALRPIFAEDLPTWVSLINQNTELGTWELADAESHFGPDNRIPLAGCFFITAGDAPVATAHLSEHEPKADNPTAGLEYVAVSPDHQGRGLGYVVCLAVLRLARARGHRESYLLTDDHRLPAIATYRKLGFEPWLYDPTAPERWQAVMEKLRQRQHRPWLNGGE